MGQRARLTPAGHAAIDQLRIALQTDIRTKAQTLHDAGAETLNQHIRTIDQLQQNVVGARLARIDSNAAPTATKQTAVGIEEMGDLTIDTNHFRAHIRQHHGGERCRADRVHFHYFHTRQGSCHRLVLSCRRKRAGCRPTK
ncbi:hypothetical protein D9M70_365360 [compost metagenome]